MLPNVACKSLCTSSVATIVNQEHIMLLFERLVDLFFEIHLPRSKTLTCDADASKAVVTPHAQI